MDTTATRPHVGRDEPRDDAARRAPLPGRSLATLFSDLWRETSTLVHDELALARAELSEKASSVGTAASSIGAGAMVLLAGFILLLIAASNALAQVLPPDLATWLAPLIVGGVVMIVGAIMLATGRQRLKAHNLAPSRTIESIRRDARLAKEHVR